MDKERPRERDVRSPVDGTTHSLRYDTNRLGNVDAPSTGITNHAMHLESILRVSEVIAAKGNGAVLVIIC